MFTQVQSGIFWNPSTRAIAHRAFCFLRYHLILWSWSCRAVVVECSDVRSGGWKEVASERATLRPKSLSEVARSETGLIDEALRIFASLLYGGVIESLPTHILGPICLKGWRKHRPWSFCCGVVGVGGFFRSIRNLDVFAFRSIQVLQELLEKFPEKFSRFSWQVSFSC